MEAGAAKGTDRRRLGFLDSFSGLGGTTPVDIKRVRKLLKAGEMEDCRCAKEFVNA